jgi:hypothetical protein
MIHFLKINAPFKTHKDEKIKIKLEVDTDPALGFGVESLFHFVPIPFAVRLYDLPSLFSGKMHALLFRQRTVNVKGRDWYEFVWYIAHATPINLVYLKNKMVQTQDWSATIPLTIHDVRQILEDKIKELDLVAAKKDVELFLKDTSNLDIWSKDFFLASLQRLNEDGIG